MYMHMQIVGPTLQSATSYFMQKEKQVFEFIHWSLLFFWPITFCGASTVLFGKADTQLEQPKVRIYTTQKS